MYPSSRNSGLKAGTDNKAGESSDVCSTATSDSSSPPAQNSTAITTVSEFYKKSILRKSNYFVLCKLIKDVVYFSIVKNMQRYAFILV